MSSEGSSDLTLFDFTGPDADINGWIESSDTVRQQGMSKAIMALQQSQLFKRAIFFALLNPQPNGAGFAGIRHLVEFNLSDHTNITLKTRGQGQQRNFKVTLKHRNEIEDGSPSYEQFFSAPSEFEVVNLPIDEFKPYWRGQYLPDADPLDTSNITSFGIQYYGGVYEDQKQSGPATLEIDWIKASL